MVLCAERWIATDGVVGDDGLGALRLRAGVSRQWALRRGPRGWGVRAQVQWFRCVGGGGSCAGARAFWKWGRERAVCCETLEAVHAGDGAPDREAWARPFFENWWASLKWQRLKPYEKFVPIIERHWGGIAADCQPENTVALGFVEGLNTKIRVLQRRAYGLRDEEYLRLKVLTSMLPQM